MDEDKGTDMPSIFNGICRACIKKNRELFPLFGGAKIKFGEKCFTISEILFLGGRVKTNCDDKLPKHVCRKCLTRLIEIFSFQLKCIESDIKLKNHLSKHMSMKTETNVLLEASPSKETEIPREFTIKSEKVDSTKIGFSETELEKSIVEVGEREINDGTHNVNSKGSISDIVVSILEDKDQQVSVSMTVTLNDKNQARQTQDNRIVQDLRSFQEKDDSISAKDNFDTHNLSNQLSNDVSESFLKNNLKPFNSENEKTHGNFVCTFCKHCFDTWSDLGKHIVKHKVQNNYGRLKSESPTFEISSSAEIKEHLEYSECSQDFNLQEHYDIHMENHNKKVFEKDIQGSEENDITLSVLSEQEMPILTAYPQSNVEERFYCSFCPANYKYESDLRKHIRKKHKKISKENYSCSICFKKFKLYVEFIRHRRRYHRNLPKNRDLLKGCTAEYDLESENDSVNIDERNMENNTIINEEKEIITEETTNLTSNIEKSNLNNSVNGRFYCMFCSSHYARRADYGTHLRVKHNKKLSNIERKLEMTSNFATTSSSAWKCQQCSTPFSNQKSLLVHYQRKHGKTQKKQTQPIFKCKICFRIFVNEKALKLHVSSNHRLAAKSSTRSDKKQDSSIYKCKHCDDKFSTLFNWNKHIFTKHRNSNLKKNIFECQVCRKTFLREFSLKNHLKTHKVNIFTRENNVIKKNLTSTDFENEHHNVSLNSTKPLNSLVSENVNEVHKCLICPSIFHNRANLRKHSRTRHSDKVKEYNQEKTSGHLYQCYGCYKWFLANSHLKSHYNFHIIQKVKGKGLKLKCDICDKTFNTIKEYSQHLTVHRAAAHRTNRYCKDCLLIFPNEKGYKLHLNGKHKSSS